MGSLTSILHVVTGALAANQTALSATAENISNLNTAGYTRRVVNFSDGDVVTVGAGASTGVQANVTAQRDRVLQKTVQQATEASSASSTRLAAINALQDFFKINGTGEDASGIGGAIGGFFNAASSLSATPADSTAQQSLYVAAGTLASTLNRAAAQITGQTSALNQQVTSSVGQVNTLTTQVAALNQQIGNTTGGDERNTLIDQRDSVVTQIAQLVDVNTIAGSNGSLDLALSDGTPLVTGAIQLSLATATVSGKVQVYAPASGGGGDVTGAIRGGSVGGYLSARDGDLASVTTQLDVLAAAIGTAVNTQNAAGTTLAGAAGTAIFSGTTAATLTVTAANGSAFASTGSAGGNGSNALAIANLQNAPLVSGGTPSSAFAGLLSGLGETASGAGTQAAADTAILTQTGTQLDATSGVSLDQEASNLTQYQRSYEAAAKVLSIVNDLLAQAINLGQPTTVS